MRIVARLFGMMLILLISVSCSIQDEVVIDREEARLAFELLNDIRLHAPLYREDLSLPAIYPSKNQHSHGILYSQKLLKKKPQIWQDAIISVIPILVDME